MGSAVSPVRMITFDLDDTLWPCWPVIRHAEQILYAWLQQRAPRVALAHDTKSLRSHRVAFAQSRPDLKHDLTALRRLALHELLAEHAHDVALQLSL